MTRGCLFCGIIKGEVQAHKVGEDSHHLAFLTPYPNTPGVTVVVTKQHLPSYVLAAEEMTFAKLMLFAKHMAKKIDRNLKTQRTGLVAEGYGIDHLHVKLYPLHGVDQSEWRAIESKDRTFYDCYTGMIATNDGPEMDADLLAQIAVQIRGERGKKKEIQKGESV